MSKPDCLPAGDWRLLSSNPVSGEQTWFLDDGEHYHTAVVVDPDLMMEANNRSQTDNLNRPFGDMAQVARMPMHMWQEKIAPAIKQEDERYIKKFLNDIDNRKFRTKLGTL